MIVVISQRLSIAEKIKTDNNIASPALQFLSLLMAQSMVQVELAANKKQDTAIRLAENTTIEFLDIKIRGRGG
ncbi:MAG: hypothetical protein WCO71_00125 [Pseudomonadota bacterium]|jgi:hypothetical protein